MNALFENRKNFDEEIDRVLKQMSEMQVDSDEYRKAVDNLKVLCDAKGVKSHSQLSADVIVGAIANVVGILLVLNYEKANIITSKAISFIFKGRG